MQPRRRNTTGDNAARPPEVYIAHTTPGSRTSYRDSEQCPGKDDAYTD